ncbi:MAG TPA: hypothetical protein VHA52_12610 [Candidatus Babeliaceae bacterium]|nr:hypothetical protein [Candidatus Babeliaceae bacterium]
MNKIRQAILNQIDTEREKQEKMWGNDNDDTHSEEMWDAIVVHELGQSCFHDDDSATFRKQMIKVAAVAVAAIESLDRSRSGFGKINNPND